MAGAILAAGFTFALDSTNTTEFCSSCHSMQWVNAELEESLHHKNAAGIEVGCADCHVPEPIGPKMWVKFMALKDIYHEILGTVDSEEKFEAHRWDMANRVWAKMRANDSRECRSCHDYDSMDLDEQDRTARKKHRTAQKDGETCIECHAGIAHEEPDEPEESDEKLAASTE
jgi:cytochrome c-type protein NapC